MEEINIEELLEGERLYYEGIEYLEDLDDKKNIKKRIRNSRKICKFRLF